MMAVTQRTLCCILFLASYVHNLLRYSNSTWWLPYKAQIINYKSFNTFQSGQKGVQDRSKKVELSKQENANHTWPTKGEYSAFSP